MNVYFACAITGGREDQAVYAEIVNTLLAAGHAVPTAALASPEALFDEGALEPAEVYQRDINWIMNCDLLVAEVSTPSHGVGYEIAYALGLGKPVFCCYKQEAKVSKMILGNADPNLMLCRYQNADAALVNLSKYLEQMG
jgi:nucleoside 2-deoxyribosyltransferase